MKRVRALDIIMATGKQDPLDAERDDLSGLLWSKGMGNVLRELARLGTRLAVLGKNVRDVYRRPRWRTVS